MRMLAAIAFLLCWASVPVSANPFPALYDVAGVTSDDVLNIRRDPTADSAIIGQLAPNQRNVEVMRNDRSGKWGLINTGEGSGWVAMRFMHPAARNDDYALGRQVHCFGTEPFWSLDVVQGQSATFSSLMEKASVLPAGLITVGAGRLDRFLLGLGDDAVAVIARGSCNDGMSDREYGLEISLITNGPELTLYSGCCSIAPR